MGRVRCAGGSFSTTTSVSVSRRNAAAIAITVFIPSMSNWGGRPGLIWQAADGRRNSVSHRIDLEKLIAASGDAIIAADPEGKIILWNPAAERIFGFTAGETVGRTLD